MPRDDRLAEHGHVRAQAEPQLAVADPLEAAAAGRADRAILREQRHLPFYQNKSSILFDR